MKEAIEELKELTKQPRDTIVTVCFFLPSGKTFTFRNARITLDSNETVIVINYTSMSDDQAKTVTMQKSDIVGLATN